MDTSVRLLGGCQDIPSPPTSFLWLFLNFQVSFTKLWTGVSFLLFAQIFLVTFQNTVNVHSEMQSYLHRELKNTELCSLSEPPIMKQLKQGFIALCLAKVDSLGQHSLTVRHFLFFFSFFFTIMNKQWISLLQCILIFQPRSFSFKEQKSIMASWKAWSIYRMICNLQIYRLTNLHHKLND